MNFIISIIIIMLMIYIFYMKLKKESLKEEIFIFYVEIPYLELEKNFRKEIKDVL